jgi:hypothetical protein
MYYNSKLHSWFNHNIIMTYIDVTGGRKKERELVLEAAYWCVGKLMPRMRTLEIEIELHNLVDCEGLCNEYHMRYFMLEIQRGMEYEDLLTTVFHEIVHVKQHARNQFEATAYKTHDEYLAQPCEIEAYRMQEELLELWKEEKATMNICHAA